MEKTEISSSREIKEIKNDPKGSHTKSEEVTEEKLKRILEIIQNSSVRTKEVYKGLTYIRTRILNNSSSTVLLLKLNGVKTLLNTMSVNNEDILNITISILGNLCNHLIMNEDFRVEIVNSKIAGRLVAILKKITKVSILKRICRFIGNLAQSDLICRDLHSAGVTYMVLQVLKDALDPELQQIAIRALRWLWHVDKHHSDMLKAGVIRVVASHLPSKDPLVEKATLRALTKFTQQRSIQMAEQVHGAGQGYQVIIDRLDEPVVAVLVSNLSHVPLARIELCKVGIVPAILARIQQGKNNSYLVSGLCRMCRESMIRASLRQTENGFSTILSLLSSPKTKHFYPELLDAIVQFNYDQRSLLMMVRCGLIGVLIDRLDEYMKVHCTGHVEAVATDCMGPPLSPASSWAPSPSPPPNSPPPTSPPRSSGEYSPQCSTPPSDSDSSNLEPTSLQDRLEPSIGLDGSVLDVLNTLSYQGIPMRALASKHTIITLLDYLARLSYPRFQVNFQKAKKALATIIVCKHYWNTLLDNESVLEIHGRLCRPIHQDCWECKRLVETGLSILRDLALTAQSGLGEGEITYRLTGACNSARLTSALTVPHVIRQPNLLETLLFSHGALSVLLEALTYRPEEAVPSIQSLFATLKVKNPQLPSHMCPGCEVGNIRKESNLRLMVDDGTTVTANREALSHACPVFEAMFRGGFMESTQSCVRLPDISSACLSHLTRVLPEYCSCALPKDLTILLEMISVTDRFLLPDLTEKVVAVVRDFALAPSTAPEIYHWALRTGQQYPITANLSMDVVTYIFSSDILPVHRLNAVSTIISSENKDTFLQDIRNLIRTEIDRFSRSNRYMCFKLNYD